MELNEIKALSDAIEARSLSNQEFNLKVLGMIGKGAEVLLPIILKVIEDGQKLQKQRLELERANQKERLELERAKVVAEIQRQQELHAVVIKDKELDLEEKRIRIRK